MATLSERAVPVRVLIVTLDSHLASAVERAKRVLREELPGLDITLHAVTEWAADPDAKTRFETECARADVIVALGQAEKSEDGDGGGDA